MAEKESCSVKNHCGGEVSLFKVLSVWYICIKIKCLRERRIRIRINIKRLGKSEIYELLTVSNSFLLCCKLEPA